MNLRFLSKIVFLSPLVTSPIIHDLIPYYSYNLFLYFSMNFGSIIINNPPLVSGVKPYSILKSLTILSKKLSFP